VRPEDYCRPNDGFGRTAAGAPAVEEPSLPTRIFRDAERDGRGKGAAAKIVVGLTDQTLSCAARAHVATAERHDTRLHVRRAMRVACRRDDFDFTRRLGRRAEAGPCQLLRRVRPPCVYILRMHVCWQHFHAGLLPCPWKRCANGLSVKVFDAYGRRWRRSKFTGIGGEKIYAWTADDLPAIDVIERITRRAVAMLNGLDKVGSDGFMHHFTTAWGAVGILESGTFWLTHYDDLADATELRHGLDTAREIFATDAHFFSDDTQWLLMLATQTAPPEACFVSCFSIVPNSDVHWQDYAGIGTGARLTFNVSPFDELISADGRAVTVSRLAYAPMAKSALLRTFEKITDEIVRFDRKRSLFEPGFYVRALQRVLTELLPLFKRESYAPEREVRIVVAPTLTMTNVASAVPVRERSRGDASVRYITTQDFCPEFQLPLRSVQLGRHADKSTTDTIMKLATLWNVPVDRQ
jgi:hypothetical protein